MDNSKSAAYYIENLNVYSWVFYILPHFLRNKMKALEEAAQIYYISNSRLGLWLANFTLRFVKAQLKKASFSQGDTRDKDGKLVWMKTLSDAVSIQNYVKNNAKFQKALESFKKASSLNLFLSKWMMASDLITVDEFLLLKFLFFIRCIELQENLNKHLKTSRWNVFLFMQKRPWFSELGEFVKSKGINIIPCGNFYFHVKVFLLKFDNLKYFIKKFCKQCAYYWMVMCYRFKRGLFLKEEKNDFNNTIRNDGSLEPYIAVEYYGYLNLHCPEKFSDLFFLHKSSLLARNVLTYFGLPKRPIGDKEWNEIKKCGMSGIAINPQAAATPAVPLFKHKRGKNKIVFLNNEVGDKADIFTREWLHQYSLLYSQRYNYWFDFITQHNVKIHVTWLKYSPDHCVVSDALKNTGGVGVVYERSFEHSPAPWTFIKDDVVFGSSKLGAHIGRDKNSIIPYYVVTGYLGDYRFGLLKRAHEVHNLLKSHGAKRIMAYFDEHASNKPLWNLSYQITLKNYAYLLNKVLENRWFGLILKPKVPSTLRLRLGSVSKLLCSAEKTGRCFVFEDEDTHCSYPPAIAALGSDIAIHGHLFAATAGIESALAGIPTLILDSEGVEESPLHNLGYGHVIFKDIEPLWQACMEHWHRPGGTPRFGDWSRMLNELDPFRDGRAAERMGTYLEWLMEGFKAKLPRETVLADAAERYARIWGKDKILSVNASLQTDFSKSQLTPIG